MKEKRIDENENIKIINFKDLPDTITPEDYSHWRRIGENYARERFNSDGFPTIKIYSKKSKKTINRLLADKYSVVLYELGLDKEEKDEILKEIAREMIKNEFAK